jgi:hypothetical protein
MSERSLVAHATPRFFVSVAFKGLRFPVSGLESKLAGIFVFVDSKGLASGRFGHNFDRRWLALRFEKVAGPKKKRQLEAGAIVYPRGSCALRLGNSQEEFSVPAAHRR